MKKRIDVAALLRAWNDLYEAGKFPADAGYIGYKFAPWDARLEVFASWDEEEPRVVVAFQLFGHNHQAIDARDENATLIVVIGDRARGPLAEVEADWGHITCPQPYRGVGDDSLGDEEAPREGAQDVIEPRGADGDWARIQRFRVRVDDAEYVLEPSFDDCVRAGVELTRRRYDANPTISLTTIGQIANVLLADKMWHPDVLSHPRVSSVFARGNLSRVYVEDGLDVLSHIDEDFDPDDLDPGDEEEDPSETTLGKIPRWRTIAELLARGPTKGKPRAPTKGTTRSDEERIEAAILSTDGFRPKRSKQPITDEERARVAFVKVTDVRHFSDISSLERYPAIRELLLFRTNVADLTAVAKLTELEELNLHGCPVTDLTPLVHCTKLRNLTLTKTRVRNLEPLSKLQQLESLYIDSTEVADLSPLASLPKLRTLCILRTDVTSLHPLRGLPLVALWANLTKVEDVSPLADATKLGVLTLPPSVSNVDVLRDIPAYEAVRAQIEKARSEAAPARRTRK